MAGIVSELPVRKPNATLHAIDHLDYMHYLAIKEVCDVLEHPETDFVKLTQELNWEITKLFIKKQGEKNGAK